MKYLLFFSAFLLTVCEISASDTEELELSDSESFSRRTSTKSHGLLNMSKESFEFEQYLKRLSEEDDGKKEQDLQKSTIIDEVNSEKKYNINTLFITVPKKVKLLLNPEQKKCKAVNNKYQIGYCAKWNKLESININTNLSITEQKKEKLLLDNNKYRHGLQNRPILQIGYSAKWNKLESNKSIQ